MARLFTAASWVFSFLAINLAILCPLATPQQARADGPDCSCCDPSDLMCNTNCQQAYNQGCNCGCVNGVYEGGQAYSDCMSACGAGIPYCGRGTPYCNGYDEEDCSTGGRTCAGYYRCFC